MARTSEIDDIPASKVDQVVQDFKDAGAANVTKTRQADDNFSVVATFNNGNATGTAAAQPVQGGPAPPPAAGTASINGISTNRDVSDRLSAIQQAGITFVCRYYCARTTSREKRLTAEEARAISGAGLQIVAVYEDAPTDSDYFSSSRGHLDGVNAYHYGNLLHQPRGSAIYFAVDYDAKPEHVTGPIRDYFQGVKQGFTDAGQGNPIYDIGVYGSGMCCDWLKQHLAVVKYSWLAESAGWNGSRSYRDWDIQQKIPPGDLAGLRGTADGDYETNAGRANAIGGFSVIIP